MDNEQIGLMEQDTPIAEDKNGEVYTPKERELIRQLVQERLGKKKELDFESLDDYVVPPRMFFSMLKKPAVSIRANRIEFNMSSIRLFEGVQHIIPMLSDRKKRLLVVTCAEEEMSSIEWAKYRADKDKWVNRSVTCPEYTDRIYSMMEWNRECRYKAYGHISNSERGLVLVFDLEASEMFDPLPTEYFDKRSGKMKKRTQKYYPDEIRMKLGRSYSDYMAIQEKSGFEALTGYTDSNGEIVDATITDEDAAAISRQEQAEKQEMLYDMILGNGGGQSEPSRG